MMPRMIAAMRNASLLVALIICSAIPARAQTLTFRGCHPLPVRNFPGLSGITYAGEGKFFGVLERESQVVPMQITFAADGDVETFASAAPIKIAGGKDLEGIAIPPGRGDRLLISNETSEIFEVGVVDGKVVRALPVPEV